MTPRNVRHWSRLLSALAAFAIATPLPARAKRLAPAPTSAHAGTGTIEFDIPDPYTANSVTEWLREATEKVLAEQPEGQQASLRIKVRLLGNMGAYELAVAATDDTEAPTLPSPTKCECLGEDLVALYETQLRTLVAELTPEPPPQPPTEDVPTEAPPEEPPLPPEEADDPTPLIVEPLPPPARGGIGALGGTGIGVLVVGVGAFAFGLTRAIQGEESVSNELFTESTQYKTPATDAALGLGVVAIAAGIAMVTVDQLVCRNRPRGCKRPAAPDTVWAPNRPFSLHF